MNYEFPVGTIASFSSAHFMLILQNICQFQRNYLLCPLRDFLASFSQPLVSPLPPGINLKGKTAIMTGSNGRIGYEAARQLLALNTSNVILAVRSMSKGKDAPLAADSTVKLQIPDANIKVIQLDMDDCHELVLHLSPPPLNLIS